MEAAIDRIMLTYDLLVNRPAATTAEVRARVRPLANGRNAGDAMSKPEPLCDLRFVKAECRLARPTDEAPDNFFDISIRPLAGGKHTFSTAEKNGEQFAAELDVLAALIRGCVIRPC